MTECQEIAESLRKHWQVAPYDDCRGWLRANWLPDASEEVIDQVAEELTK